MAEVKRVRIELLSDQAFAPFGQIVGAGTQPPTPQGSGISEAWTVDFHTEGTPRVQITRAPFQGYVFSKLERHFTHTKVAVPLAGSPAVVAVARPTDPVDRGSIPDPEEVRAFLFDGTKGYILKKATWHSVDRYPLYPPATIFVVFGDHETATDLKLGFEGKGGFKLTQQVDYLDQCDLVFELAL